MKTSNPEEFGLSSESLKRIGSVMQRYVDEKKLAGIVTLVARRGNIVHFEKCGAQNIEANKPMEFDTIFRIYSMTKPITSVALMMLFEQGLIRLTDPVAKFIPEFKKVKVLDRGGKLTDIKREITIHDLLTHTAGLSYGEYEDETFCEIYRKAELYRAEITIQEFIRRLTDLPLLYQPGEVWHYSSATDVVGHIVEVISDMPLAEFFDREIFKPLGMDDTGFYVPSEEVDRFATLYGMTENSALDVIDNTPDSDYSDKTNLHTGGHGLVSTTSDYLRFAQFILNKGELNGVRLLGPKTIELMTTNHLPPALLPIEMGEPWPGFGFGLGFSVMMDVAQSGMMGSVGLHSWGGAASTHFWVDPQEQIVGILMLQYLPSGTYPVTNDFRTLVYQALVD